VTLTLKYPASLPPHVNEAQLAIYTLVNGRWSALESSVDKANRTVSAQLHHFSEYAIASPPPANGVFWRNTGGYATGWSLIRITSGSETALANQYNVNGDAFVTWSPDGSRIAYSNTDARPHTTSSNLGVWITSVGGSTQQLLVPDGDRPVWSPDGGTIALTVRGEDGYQNRLRLVNPDGTGLTGLPAAEPYSMEGYRWSPDGGKIAFIAWSPTSIPHLYVINRDGSGLRRLSSEQVLQTWNLSWAPDGQRIYFAESRGIFSVRVDGTGLRQITVAPQEGYDDRIDGVAPQGDKITFTRYDNSADEVIGVYTVNVDGTGEQLVASQARLGLWSPDGQQIVYRYPPHDLWIMMADGTNKRRLHQTEGYVESGYSWHP
jgi:Tol biopolymer transport system component